MYNQPLVTECARSTSVAGRQPTKVSFPGLFALWCLTLALWAAPGLHDATAAQLSVVHGSGSGDYAPGTLVHIWANPYESADPHTETSESPEATQPDRVFSHWSGDVEYLSDPVSYSPTLIMPYETVTLQAEYDDAPRWISPRVLKAFPDAPQGVILMFHGHNGSAESVFDSAETKSFIRAALRRDLGVVAIDSFSRAERRWDDTDDPLENVDLQRVGAVWQELLADGVVRADDPIYALGISNGGIFTVLLARHAEAVLGTNLQATAIYGHPAGLMQEQDPTPTILLVADKDEIVNNDLIWDGYANLVNRGVATQLLTNYESPLYPRRFWRIAGVSAYTSEQLVASIADAGLLDPDNFLVPEAFEDFDGNGSPDWWDALPKDFEWPADEIETQLYVVSARHAFFGDSNERTLDFLLNPTTIIDRVPFVGDFTPSSGPADTLVTISGSGFVDVQEVSFNGAPAEFALVNSRSLQARVPATATTGPLVVRNSVGSATSAADFVVDGPRIDSFEPVSAPVGTLVTVLGANLKDVTSVTFGGISAVEIQETWDGSRLFARVPNGAETGPIVVATVATEVTSAEDFVVEGPRIDSFEPASAPVGAVVTILGANLRNVNSVTFDGVPAAELQEKADGSLLYARVPNGAETGPIMVATAAGDVTSTEDFIVEGMHLDSFQPASAPIGAVVTILGANLRNVTSVTIAGVPASEFQERADGSELYARVPAGAETGPIVVSTITGDATSQDDFVVMLPPVITSVTPTSGPVGTEVTISGSGFNATAAVAFRPRIASSFEVLSDTELRAIVPPSALNGPITVQTPAGVVTSAERFKIQPD